MKPDNFGFYDMVHVLQPGRVCADDVSAEIRHVTITKKDADAHNILASPRPFARLWEIEPGEYAQLLVNGRMVMSDTTGERYSNSEALLWAHGDMLIGGLGLGMLVYAALRKPQVNSITVIENSPCVIELVEPQIRDDRLKVVQDDVFTWKPPRGQRWDCIWFDVWGDPSFDTLEEIARLHQKYKNRRDTANEKSWMKSWMHDYLKHRRREEGVSFGY